MVILRMWIRAHPSQELVGVRSKSNIAWDKEAELVPHSPRTLMSIYGVTANKRVIA